MHRLRIACRYDRATIADGASIACNGVCLTVVASGVEQGKTWFDVDAAAETLGMTTAKHWTVGTRLNLERALKIGDELGGHIVAGHADGVAGIVKRDDLPDMARFELTTSRELARFIAAKGSVTLDGVSLTVNTRAGRRVFGADHSAHARCHDAWRLARRRRGQSRGRSDGALCRAAVGNEIAASPWHCDPAAPKTQRNWHIVPIGHVEWRTRGAHH